MKPFTLQAHRTAVVLIDFQIRLFQAMDETISFRHAKNAEHMVFAAGAFEVPLIVTEQLKMGRTLPSLEVPEGTTTFAEKTHFSCFGHAGFEDTLRETGVDTLIISGIETHVCVAQTVRDALGKGFQVVVVADACLSRRRMDYRLGLRRMQNAGAHIWTAEAVLFELQGCFEGARAKEISRRIR